MISLYFDFDGVILRRTGRREFNSRTELEVTPGAYELMD